MTEVRPLRPDDVAAADLAAFASLSAMSAVWEGTPVPERSSRQVDRSRYRITHLLGTDPAGCWVAVDGTDVVGVALSLRRGPLWFLSLLTVAADRQAQGIGRRLLNAALATAEGAQVAYLCASRDPKAIRRYVLAGFRPRPAYAAIGTVDTSLIPTALAVRDGDWRADGDLVNDVVTALRGAGYGPEIGAMQAVDLRLLVADRGADRGFCILRDDGVAALGATTGPVAQRLLWRALAEVTAPEVTLDWLTADQQWAIDVAVAARLPLLAGPSVAVRSATGPMTPYLPSGIYG